MSLFTPLTSTYYSRKDLIISTVNSERDMIYITDNIGNVKYKFGGHGHTTGKFNFCSKSYTYPCVIVKNGESVNVTDEVLISKENITNCQKVFTLYLEHGNIDFSQPITITDGVETFTYDTTTGTLVSSNENNIFPQIIDDFSGRIILVFLETPTNDITVTYNYFSDLIICSDVFNHRIQLLYFDGKPYKYIKNNFINTPCGLTLNSDETELFICNRSLSQIAVFDTTTYEMTTHFGKYGHGDGELRAPHDIYLVNDDTIVVTDTGNNRLVQFIRKNSQWVADNPYTLYTFSKNSYKSHTLGALAITSNNNNGYVISDYHVGVVALYDKETGKDGKILIDRGFSDDTVYFPKGIRLKNGNNILIVANTGRYADILHNRGLPKPPEMKIEYPFDGVQDEEDSNVYEIISGGRVADVDINNFEIISGGKISEIDMIPEDTEAEVEIISGRRVADVDIDNLEIISGGNDIGNIDIASFEIISGNEITNLKNVA